MVAACRNIPVRQPSGGTLQRAVIIAAMQRETYGDARAALAGDLCLTAEVTGEALDQPHPETIAIIIGVIRIEPDAVILDDDGVDLATLLDRSCCISFSQMRKRFRI